jgi:hypothetical protein
MIKESELEPEDLEIEDEFTEHDVCGECEDPQKCVSNQGCILEDENA